MIKAILRCCVLAVPVILAGCAGYDPATNYMPTTYWMVKGAALKNLKAGTSTKDDVLRDVGIPWLKSFFPRQGEEVWEYRYLDGTTTHMLAYLYFDTKGIYKSSYQVLDPAHYSGGDY